MDAIFPPLQSVEMGPPRAPVSVADAGSSDAGAVRPRNEDTLVLRADAGLWAVADGMGGHAGGAWASEVIASAIAEVEMAGELETDCERLAMAIHDANWTIYSRAAAGGVRIGSTVAALLLDANRFAVLWAGDSRAYRLRGGGLVQLTKDHTQIQERVDRGALTAAEAWRHPMSHILTRAVGVDAALDLACVQGEARADDVFLLCSDGLHGVATDAEIASILSTESPDGACQALLALCRLHGAPDNVTTVVVRAAGAH